MARRRSRKLIEADRFRAVVVSLSRVPHSDWRDYEEEWLEDEVKRPDDYIYSDPEWKILNQLVASAKTFTQYAGYTVQELLAIAYPSRADFDLSDEEFLELLQAWRAVDLKVRQICYLAKLSRHFEPIGRDQDVEEVLLATRRKDTSHYGDGDGLSPLS